MIRAFLFFSFLLVLISCRNSSALKEEFIKQRILEYKSSSDSLTISNDLLKWDTADLLVRYLNKPIDTTTLALELGDVLPISKPRIISLFDGVIKRESVSFQDQIKDQLEDQPIKNESKIKGDFRMNLRTIKFSQPLLSPDKTTMIIK